MRGLQAIQDWFEAELFKTPMRERQLTQSLLTKALLKARESSAKRIKTIELVLGEIAELDRSSIQQHWNEMSRGTPAERAQLRFRLIKAKVQCMACFREYQPVEGKIHCPYCGSYGAKVLAGEEFYLGSIEVDDE